MSETSAGLNVPEQFLRGAQLRPPSAFSNNAALILLKRAKKMSGKEWFSCNFCLKKYRYKYSV